MENEATANWDNLESEPVLPTPAVDSPAEPIREHILDIATSQWPRAIYNNAFDVIFGSWMGKFGCPFL